MVKGFGNIVRNVGQGKDGFVLRPFTIAYDLQQTGNRNRESRPVYLDGPLFRFAEAETGYQIGQLG